MFSHLLPTQPPETWNPFLVRELRRGSWLTGLLPRVAIYQSFALWVWFGPQVEWSWLPAVAALATALLESRCAVAEFHSTNWEHVRTMEGGAELWWNGWKTLNFLNHLAAVSTLSPWVLLTFAERETQWHGFLLSLFLSCFAASLAFRRWVAVGVFKNVAARVGATIANLPAEMVAGYFFHLIPHSQGDGLPLLIIPFPYALYLGVFGAFYVRERICEYPRGVVGLGLLWWAALLMSFWTVLPFVLLIILRVLLGRKTEAWYDADQHLRSDPELYRLSRESGPPAAQR